MSLHFGGGTGDHVDFAIGNAANLGNGAFTIMLLWKHAGNTGLLAGLNSATERQGVLLSPGLFGSGDFSSGFGSPVNGDWHWLGLSKPAGAAHYRGHIRDYTTAGAWSHGEAVGAANHTDPGVSNSIHVGAIPSTAASQGDIAVAGVWTSALSDAAIEAACTAALTDLIASSPVWAARFLQSAPTSIQDLIGTGHESARTGTITATADPPAYNFSLTPPAVNGSGSAALGALTGTGAGSRLKTGAAVATLGGLVATGAGVRSKVGAGTTLLGAVAAAGAGIRSKVGAGAAVLGAPVAAGAGVRSKSGAGVALLGALHAVGTVPSTGTVVPRPDTGTITRPSTGIITRPTRAYP